MTFMVSLFVQGVIGLILSAQVISSSALPNSGTSAKLHHYLIPHYDNRSGYCPPEEYITLRHPVSPLLGVYSC